MFTEKLRLTPLPTLIKWKPNPVEPPVNPENPIKSYIDAWPAEYTKSIEELNGQLPAPQKTNQITTVIAARNESHNLSKTLAVLTRQPGLSSDQFEIIILCNNPTNEIPDDSRQRIQNFIDSRQTKNIHTVSVNFSPADATVGSAKKTVSDLSIYRHPYLNEYTYTADADMLSITPDYMKILLQAFTQGYGCVSGVNIYDQLYLESLPNLSILLQLTESVSTSLVSLYPVHFNPGSTICIRNAVCALVGGIEFRKKVGVDRALTSKLIDLKVPQKRLSNFVVETSARRIKNHPVDWALNNSHTESNFNPISPHPEDTPDIDTKILKQAINKRIASYATWIKNSSPSENIEQIKENIRLLFITAYKNLGRTDLLDLT